jgi:hypothetical protein
MIMSLCLLFLLRLPLHADRMDLHCDRRGVVFKMDRTVDFQRNSGMSFPASTMASSLSQAHHGIVRRTVVTVRYTMALTATRQAHHDIAKRTMSLTASRQAHHVTDVSSQSAPWH